MDDHSSSSVRSLVTRGDEEEVKRPTRTRLDSTGPASTAAHGAEERSWLAPANGGISVVWPRSIPRPLSLPSYCWALALAASGRFLGGRRLAHREQGLSAWRCLTTSTSPVCVRLLVSTRVIDSCSSGVLDLHDGTAQPEARLFFFTVSITLFFFSNLRYQSTAICEL